MYVLRLRNNLANIAIPPMLAPYVRHNCHHNHIQSLHSDAFKFQSEVSSIGISFLTIWQLNHHLTCFALQPPSATHPYTGTRIWAQIPGVWFYILLSFFGCCCLLFVVLPFFGYLFNVCLYNYWHLSMMAFYSNLLETEDFKIKAGKNVSRIVLHLEC